MADCDLIDTFPRFLECWAEAEHEPLASQLDWWANSYMAEWPELLRKQQDDYESHGCDWKAIALERLFPHASDRLPAMRSAHTSLLAVLEETLLRTRQVLSFRSPVTFVIYVGVGCGAGWATTFAGKPAVLFGLEMMAECGWVEPDVVKGHVAHELGHLAHKEWREAANRHEETGPFWDLYEEGFAQWCEHLVMGEESWHMKGDAEDWVGWCHRREAWLAGEFLRRVDSDESVRPFFGSWYEVAGHSQVGYYLGHQVVKSLEARMPLGEIALLENVEEWLRPLLRDLAGGAGQPPAVDG